ncbi:MAG: hypothetical protein ABMA64_29345 [Myxococcota bacterium]
MRLVPLALVLTGCNRYDLFRVTGYQQLSFSNRADVLFVIDNSDSMLPQSKSLAENFTTFITGIDATETELSYNGLPDAVGNFVQYVENRSAFLDYQFGITTTDVETDQGELLGPSVRRGDVDVPNQFISQLACEATCFNDSNVLPTDPGYACGDPITFLSEEFMTCACGGSAWEGNCGSAQEEGLEAVYTAMCRAVPNPPVECFADILQEVPGDDPNEYPSLLKNPADVGTNEGLIRENSQFIPVIVSDEGDSSRRETDSDSIPLHYPNLFTQFGTRMTWVLIGNTLESNGHVRCPGTASDWGVTRYHYFTHITDGEVIDIWDDNCDPRDFDEALSQLSDLLVNLLTSFQLQSVPVPGTVIVLVDGRQVIEAEVTGQDQFGFDEFSDGWTYRGSDNSVVFHGAAIPDYNANVEVYYQPVDGMPRELPF